MLVQGSEIQRSRAVLLIFEVFSRKTDIKINDFETFNLLFDFFLTKLTDYPCISETIKLIDYFLKTKYK